MIEYQNFLKHILENGVKKEDRTGTGTISVFGYQMRFDLAKGFPLVTTKKMFLRGVIAELLWFIEGSTDERRLAEIQYGKNRREITDKTTIWTANANKQGVDLGYRNDDIVKELGSVYGQNWRCWLTPDGERVDQLLELIEDIKKNPDSRRLILSAWNPGTLNKAALPPCHTLFQFYVVNGKLSCQLYQRSADAFLGVPFNIASYALLTMMIADICGLKYGEFVHTFGDAHIYLNHLDQVKEQISRKPYESPKMWLQKRDSILDYRMEDFVLEDYKSHDAIKAEMAV